MHLEKDTVLYQRLSEKLESLLQRYRDNWDELYPKLFELRTEVGAGRQDAETRQSGPLHDLIGQIGFGRSDLPAEHKAAVETRVAEATALAKVRHRDILS